MLEEARQDIARQRAGIVHEKRFAVLCLHVAADSEQGREGSGGTEKRRGGVSLRSTLISFWRAEANCVEFFFIKVFFIVVVFMMSVRRG